MYNSQQQCAICMKETEREGEKEGIQSTNYLSSLFGHTGENGRKTGRGGDDGGRGQ